MIRLLFTAFIVLQIGIDLAHSVTFFPFVHYGMFSRIEPRPDTVRLYEVTVDGMRLQPAGMAVYRWDMVQTPLEAFDRQTATNDFAFDKQQLRWGLQRAGAGKVYSLLKTNLDNTGDFPSWYKTYLSGLLHRPVRQLTVGKAWYRSADGRLVLLKKEPWINL
ncbi:MAG TPA: hypothetical protein VHE54_15020 [Puia sp.]|nr:hypothetical protein [Puia sp.]